MTIIHISNIKDIKISYPNSLPTYSQDKFSSIYLVISIHTKLPLMSVEPTVELPSKRFEKLTLFYLNCQRWLILSFFY